MFYFLNVDFKDILLGDVKDIFCNSYTLVSISVKPNPRFGWAEALIPPSFCFVLIASKTKQINELNSSQAKAELGQRQ
jgi:hypothetical protein